MYLSHLNFDELILPPQFAQIQHSSDYIKSGTGNNAKRRIFYEVPLDDFERQQILQFYDILQSKRIKLPHNWTERDSLKYIYSSKFDHEKASEKIKGCLEWRANPNSQTLSPGVKFILESGALYIHGRDKQFRPIMILDLAKVDFDNMKEEDFNAAVTILMDIMKDYCYIPGKVENTDVLIDLRNVSLTSVPVGAMKGFISIANACFPCTMHKTYLVGMTFMMKMSWKVVEALLSKDVVEKMQSLSDDELHKIQELIDPSHLQAKFGGNLPNLTTFWPPTSTFPHQKTPQHHSKTASFNETPRNQTPKNFEQQHSYSYRQHQQQQPYHSKTASFHETPRNQTPTNLENSYRQPVHSPPNRQFQSYPTEYQDRPDARYTADNSRFPAPYSYQNERNTSPTPSSQRNLIFSARSPRASQAQKGSPYKEKDEALIRDIIFSKPRASPPRNSSPQRQQNRVISPAPITREYEHKNYPHPHHQGPHYGEESVKRSGIARPLHAIKKDIMETLGDDRGQEKRMDERIQRQFERDEKHLMAKPAEKHNESWLSDNYTEADTGFNLNDMDALSMILKEDRHLKGLTHNIPDEENDAGKIKSMTNEVNQGPRRSDLSYERLSTTPVKAYGGETPVHFRESSYRIKSEVKGPYAEGRYEEGPRYHYDYDRYSVEKEVLRKSQRKEVEEKRQEKQVEEWPTRKVRELAMYNADESEDDDDDGTNFCGICVSKRGKKKNGKRA